MLGLALRGHRPELAQQRGALLLRMREPLLELDLVPRDMRRRGFEQLRARVYDLELRREHHCLLLERRALPDERVDLVAPHRIDRQRLVEEALGREQVGAQRRDLAIEVVLHALRERLALAHRHRRPREVAREIGDARLGEHELLAQRAEHRVPPVHGRLEPLGERDELLALARPMVERREQLGHVVLELLEPRGDLRDGLVVRRVLATERVQLVVVRALLFARGQVAHRCYGGVRPHARRRPVAAHGDLARAGRRFLLELREELGERHLHERDIFDDGHRVAERVDVKAGGLGLVAHERRVRCDAVAIVLRLDVERTEEVPEQEALEVDLRELELVLQRIEQTAVLEDAGVELRWHWALLGRQQRRQAARLARRQRREGEAIARQQACDVGEAKRVPSSQRLRQREVDDEVERAVVARQHARANHAEVDAVDGARGS